MNQPTTPIDDAHFDVREIPCRVKHAQIFQRWAALKAGEHFVLVNDHDPVPLYYQFAAQFPDGFEWEYLLRGPDEFQVKITKLREIAPAAAGTDRPTSAPPPACGTVSAHQTADVDARGLEPPEPLLRILNALEAIPAGRRLRAITDRQPCHLYGEAEQRGFRYNSREQADGSWITELERA